MESEPVHQPHTQKLSINNARNINNIQTRSKTDVCHEIVELLRQSGNKAVNSPAFVQELHAHFKHLPLRYALDVNLERTDNVLEHKRLLESARNENRGRIFCHVRSVHVLPSGLDGSVPGETKNLQEDFADGAKIRSRLYALPSFGNLEALALEMTDPSRVDNLKDKNESDDPSPFSLHMPLHEVTFSTTDGQKLLTKLSTILNDAGLNIREAHVFSTDDGFSLDVFVVDGWPSEDTQELQQQLQTTIVEIEKQFAAQVSIQPEPDAKGSPDPDAKGSPDLDAKGSPDPGFLKIPSDGIDDWEIDPAKLKFDSKLASGSFGDLFRGTYCGQDVAIKILKPELNDDLQKEFAQEVSIMRKVRHKNVVQFIGACTRPPNLCILTEYMSGGSVHDQMHKKNKSFQLPELLKVAIDVAKGMDYLHQSNIIHRDLKAANLLMDENKVVKVADFGVARVQGIAMTAETGTYRWMAPEVIEHSKYDRKADVFSYGVLVWELLTGKLPYESLTPLQAAVGVVKKGLRPTLPKSTHPKLSELLNDCWKSDPAKRPEFSEITKILQEILKEVNAADEEKDKKKGGILSVLKRTDGGQKSK